MIRLLHDPASGRLLSYLEQEYGIPPSTQLASIFAERYQRAKEEMKCLLRAQATVGVHVALANDG